MLFVGSGHVPFIAQKTEGLIYPFKFLDEIKCLHDHELSKHVTHMTKLLPRFGANYPCLGTPLMGVTGEMQKQTRHRFLDTNKRIWPNFCPKRGRWKVGFKSHSFRRGDCKNPSSIVSSWNSLFPCLWRPQKKIGEFRDPTAPGRSDDQRL